jgi:UDP-glucuronate decarboxylase
MKTILVTGGAGFLGSHLCEYLLKKGEKVICVDNFYTGGRENVKRLEQHQNFLFIGHDVNDPLIALPHIDQVYHLACPASPPHYQKDPIYTAKTNFIGSMNMLELARKNKARILITSTSEVYGDPLEHPQRESYRGNVNTIGIRSCYDEGKRIAETLFFDYHRRFGVEIRVARLFNTYGPHMDPLDGRVVSNFIMQALHNRDITVYGEGEQTRSFCYVSDTIEGLYRLMNGNHAGPMNLGNPHERTVLQIAQEVIRLTGSSSRIVFKELPLDDPTKRKPDISLAKQELGWEPLVPLEEGLKRTIEYFRSL